MLTEKTDHCVNEWQHTTKHLRTSSFACGLREYTVFLCVLPPLKPDREELDHFSNFCLRNS